MNKHWPEMLPAVQIRWARPTDKLEEVLKFYQQGLGLDQIGSFQDHAGYSGVMLGLPDSHYHLEFTEHVDGSPCPAPTKDNLLVFYIPDSERYQKLVQHMISLGYQPKQPENPYWETDSTTFEDPDGWRVVLANKNGI